MRTLIVFIARKAVRLLVLLVAVAMFSFGLISLSPIDPVNAYIGADMLQISSEQRALIATRWGLDQPVAVRFAHWLGQIAQGNLGISMIFNQPVTTVIGERFAASLGLMATAWLLSGVLGFILGIVAGAHEGSLRDRAIRLYAYTLASSPTFWVALLLLIVFSVHLRWTPICCASPPGVLPQDVTWT